MTAISIHVPREGDDAEKIIDNQRISTISIHVPREGDDPVEQIAIQTGAAFQSTSPVRGTTPLSAAVSFNLSYFNPRPP